MVNAFEVITDIVQIIEARPNKAKNSYYKSLNNRMGINGKIPLVRISNHKTHCDTWINDIKDIGTAMRFPANFFISIVIEDKPSTKSECVPIRMSPFTIHEWTFKQEELEESDIHTLIQDVKNIFKKGEFENTLGKGHYDPVNSKYCPTSVSKPVNKKPNGENKQKGGDVPNSKKIQNRKNIKKNVKRINESQLRAIVAESVKRVLREENEKDWREFAKKAIEYAQRGDYANASKYDNMAASALKEKYGLGDSQFETNFDDYKGKQQYYRSHSLGSQDPYDGTPVDTYSKSLDGNADRSWKRTSGLLPKDAENDLNDYFGS